MLKGPISDTKNLKLYDNFQNKEINYFTESGISYY